jgi:hypothetical protein
MRKYRADASVETQLKIDSLDQNHLQHLLYAPSACWAIFSFQTQKLKEASTDSCFPFSCLLVGPLRMPASS